MEFDTLLSRAKDILYSKYTTSTYKVEMLRALIASVEAERGNNDDTNSNVSERTGT